MNYVNSVSGKSTAYEGSGGGGTTAMSAPIPMSPMQEARQRLDEATNVLHARIGDMEARLDGLCRPTGPDVAGQESKAEQTPSEHRAFLAQQTGMVGAAIQRIDRLLGRLEV